MREPSPTASSPAAASAGGDAAASASGGGDAAGSAGRASTSARSPTRAAPTELVVPREAAGARLDRFLATVVGSRAAAARAVDAGVRVDGEARPKSYRLAGGETVVITAAPDATPTGATALPPRVVYRDDHLLVVDKPAGLVVHH